MEQEILKNYEDFGYVSPSDLAEGIKPYSARRQKLMKVTLLLKKMGFKQSWNRGPKKFFTKK